jgi:hypothetical protein
MLARLAKPLELLTTTTLARLLVICLAPHFLPQPATLTQLSETADRLLDGLSGSDA